VWPSIWNASRQCNPGADEPPHSVRKHEWVGLIFKDQSIFAQALRDCSRLLHGAQQNPSASILYLPFSIRQRLDLPMVAVEAMCLLDCDLHEMVAFALGHG
jgi:hypothetical protein